MPISDADWQHEQKYVDEIRAKLARKLEQLLEKTDANFEDVKALRKDFWDEVSINISNPDDLAETHFAIRQQAELLAEHERAYGQGSKVAKTYRKLMETPFFGRVDFREAGEREIEQIYIGLSSFRDDETDTFMIYDWRAPISSLYYDYPPGEVAFQAPVGKITGEMTTKRQYVIKNGKIELLFDANVTIGDELLMEALGRHADAQMKNIVATIQREQNEVIRNDHARMLIVQGAAGSGKTSAALQRVAYLLYKHRETLKADQMVLFSPNHLFNSYVASVLPELGEENIRQTTFQEYLDRRLGRMFKLEDPFAQIEYVLEGARVRGHGGIDNSNDEHAYAARRSAIRIKSAATFSTAMQKFVTGLLDKAMRFRPLRFQGAELVSAKEMRAHFYSYEPSFQMRHRMERMPNFLLAKIQAFEDEQIHAEWVEAEIELLSDEDYEKAHRQVVKQNRDKEDDAFDQHLREREILARMVLRRKLSKLRKSIRQLKFVHMKQLYCDFLRQYRPESGEEQDIELWETATQLSIKQISNGALFYEDATPYLYLTELIQGMDVDTAIQHVFIDEAQDYSLLQVEFIQLLFPRARMTMLGDLNQSVFVHEPAFANPDALRDLHGAAHTEWIRLQRSYRSTFEIVEFTRGMAQSGHEIIPLERHGEHPQVQVVPTEASQMEAIRERIQSLQNDGFQSISIICKTAQETEQVHAALNRAGVHATLITKETFTFREGLVVIPVYLAKGVEFDAVIVANASAENYGTQQDRQLLYTACTRAMHTLHLVALEQVSPFVPSQSEV